MTPLYCLEWIDGNPTVPSRVWTHSVSVAEHWLQRNHECGLQTFVRTYL